MEVLKIDGSKQKDSPIKEAVLQVVNIVEIFAKDDKNDPITLLNLLEKIGYLGYSSLYCNLVNKLGHEKGKKLFDERVQDMFIKVEAATKNFEFRK